MELKAVFILMSPIGKRIRFKEGNNGLFIDIDYSQFVNSAYQRSGKLIMMYATHTFTLDMGVKLPNVKAVIYNGILCTSDDVTAMNENRIVSATVDGIVFRRMIEFTKEEMDTIVLMLNNCYLQQNVIEYCGFKNFKVLPLNNPSNNGVVVNCITTIDKKNLGCNLKYVTDTVLKSLKLEVGGLRIVSNNNAFVVYLSLKRSNTK